jgi:hypothetical protein
MLDESEILQALVYIRANVISGVYVFRPFSTSPIAPINEELKKFGWVLSVGMVGDRENGEYMWKIKPL